MKSLIGISSDGAGLFVQCGLPDWETERVFNVDERLAVLECDRVFILCVVFGGMAILVCRSCYSFPAHIVYLLRSQSLLLGGIFVILGERSAVAVPSARTCHGGGAYSQAPRG
jgi:hypothetical protein